MARKARASRIYTHITSISGSRCARSLQNISRSAASVYPRRGETVRERSRSSSCRRERRDVQTAGSRLCSHAPE